MSKMAEKIRNYFGSRGMRYLIHPGERYQGSLLKGRHLIFILKVGEEGAEEALAKV